jgi:3'-phosphoadenosine 5'-phosphosulfate sulfotransferase (PAPS reductase)/FAD synthetase
LLPLPAVSDVSGGRTSAMMTKRVIEAFGGKQPENLHLLFCNTGKERTETLDFVHEIETRWGLSIVWLEYRYRDGKHSFDVVDYASASRHGEPFEQVIEARNTYRKSVGKDPMLPNPIMRFCTAELKIRTKRRYMASIGLTDHRKGYHHAIGLRADEWKRVYRLTKSCSSSDECGIAVCPLHEAGIVEADVMAFWKQQPFDLQLQSYEGNCDNCFLKAKAKILRLAEERPQDLDWWAKMEDQTGATFRRDRPTYRQLVSLQTVPVGGWDEQDQDVPCHCTD